MTVKPHVDNGRFILFLGYSMRISECFQAYWCASSKSKPIGFCFHRGIRAYLVIIRESVISELSQQICQESFSCVPREELRRAAGESADPLWPLQGHTSKVRKLPAGYRHWRKTAFKCPRHPPSKTAKEARRISVLCHVLIFRKTLHLVFDFLFSC